VERDEPFGPTMPRRAPLVKAMQRKEKKQKRMKRRSEWANVIDTSAE